jgi:hypothetical protein
MTQMTEKKVTSGWSRDSDNRYSNPRLILFEAKWCRAAWTSRIESLAKETLVILMSSLEWNNHTNSLLVSAGQRLRRRSVRGKLGREETDQGLGLIIETSPTTPFFSLASSQATLWVMKRRLGKKRFHLRHQVKSLNPPTLRGWTLEAYRPTRGPLVDWHSLAQRKGTFNRHFLLFYKCGNITNLPIRNLP